jgi:hypothetical protein
MNWSGMYGALAARWIFYARNKNRRDMPIAYHAGFSEG